jgi:chitin disaccharide deacetylase
MLIVNADDWGYDASTTDAIAETFRAGRISSTTAMMWMADSERAPALAAELAIPVGLHLNLMEPFSAAAVPDAVRSRQGRVVAKYRSGFVPRWDPRRGALATVEGSVDEQMREFRDRYGEPTHVDGHQHGHLALGPLMALDAGPVDALRPSFTFARGQKSPPNRALRGLLNVWIGRHFRTVRSFHSIRTLHPRFGGSGLPEALAEARAADVEIMVHPGLADEFDLLMSAEWMDSIGAVGLGDYRQVGRS